MQAVRGTHGDRCHERPWLRRGHAFAACTPIEAPSMVAQGQSVKHAPGLRCGYMRSEARAVAAMTSTQRDAAGTAPVHRANPWIMPVQSSSEVATPDA
jgi:hypothetical protein